MSPTVFLFRKIIHIIYSYNCYKTNMKLLMKDESIYLIFEQTEYGVCDG